MNTETLEHKGYKIEVAQDDSPENPFESWDCEPPLLTYYGGRHGYFKSYKGPESMRDIVALMPDNLFQRGERIKIIREFITDAYTLRDLAETMRNNGESFRHAFASLLTERHGCQPDGWRGAIEWFDLAESLLKWAGIECVNAQSNGYSQGDSTLVLAIATPEWVKLVGAPAESLKPQLESTVELYDAWAWGDVYGVSEITSPDGEEISGGSCWGFYGHDHEKSGLMEHARDAIDYHIRQVAETALNEPACLI